MSDIKRNRKYSNTLFFVAERNFKKERWLTAIRFYRLGLLHAPDNKKMRYKLSIALSKVGAIKPAIKQLVEVVRQDPFYNDAKRRLKKYKHLDWFINEENDVTREFMDLRQPIAKMVPAEEGKFSQMPPRPEQNLYYIISSADEVEVLRGEDVPIQDAPDDAARVPIQQKIGIITTPSGAPADARMPVGIRKPKTELEKVQEYVDEGKFSIALQQIKLLANRIPGLKEYNWMRGQVFYRQKNFLKAREELRKAVGKAPTNVEYRFLYAKALYNYGEFDEAVKNYKTIIRQEPMNFFANVDLAEIYRLDGKLKLARKINEKLLAKEPGLAMTNLAVAEIDVAEKKLGEAEKKATRVLSELDEESYRAMKILGIVYFKRGEIEKALLQFNKALAVNADYSEAYFYKGLALLQEGNAHTAVSNFEKCYDRDSNNLRNIFKLVQTLVLLNNLQKAQLYLSKIFQSFPSHHRSYAVEGLFQKGDKNLALATKNMQKAIELEPNEPEYWYELADCYFLNSKSDKVISTCNDALSRFPDYEYNYQFKNFIESAKEQKKALAKKKGGAGTGFTDSTAKDSTGAETGSIY
ncbi:tetratricopeptide repeat protein [Candidatus Riflebacteria bacterium]